MLEIRVLGPLRVDLDGRPLPLGHGRRVPELLGWLALHPGLHARSRVAAAFWPDVPDGTARNNLRQITWDLRRTLGSAADRVEGDRESVGLRPSSDVWVDAWAVDAATTAGRWAEAADLAGADVLEGLEAAWLDEVRERHRLRLAEVLTALAAAQAAAGEISQAAATTRRLLELDPYDEAVLRLLVERLDAAGRRAEAVVAGEAFAARLATDLGVAPAPPTVQALARLRRAPPPARRPHAVLGAARRGLVGRRDELAAIRGLIDRATVDGQVIVGLEGDAGIGKTALAAEVAARAEADGVLVLAGRATEDELTPYQPWVEALRNHTAGRSPEVLAAELPMTAFHLLSLLPELTDAIGGSRRGATSEHPDRFRLFDAVADWLHALAAARPVLLVLDDLHTADPASLELLRHVAATPAPGPLVVLFTCRPRHATTSGPYAATLAACGQHGLSWIRLRGMGEVDLGALIARVTGAEPAAAFTHALHHRTCGNPYFAVEVVRSLQDAGTLDTQNIGALSGEDLGVVPEGVRIMLSRRLERLPRESRRALEVASVVGMEFADEILGTVLGLTEPQMLDLLDTAVGSGVLVEREPSLYAFEHPLVREVLYTGLSESRRGRLHERVGQILEAAGAPAIVVTRHLLDAGTPGALALAAERGVGAVAHALEQGAWEDARALADRLLARPEVAAGTRRDLLSLRGLSFAPEWALAAGTGPATVTQVPLPKNDSAVGPSSGGMSAGATSPASS